MKVAIVHYWFVGMRGGEKVVEALLRLFPDADIYCHVYDPAAISPLIGKRIRGATFINRLPFAKTRYQAYLPLMPLALEQLDLRGYDLVISSESGPAKGVIVDPDALHLCYCHSPMRYVWDMYHDYRATAGWLARLLMPLAMHYLRIWDVTSAARVSHFICNSHYVAARVRQYYRRSASVIHPPVAVDEFEPAADIGDYYLFVGQLVDYKRADLAVEAFNANKRPLKVVGDGPQMRRLKASAGANVELLGKVDAEQLKHLYAQCKALIFPGVEDFGIVPLEAMASGRPVIALGRGGALETVVDGETGVIFDQQSVNSLNEAILRFEERESSFCSAALRSHAERFGEARFLQEINRAIAGWAADSEVGYTLDIPR